MIEISLHIAFVALHVSFGKLRVFCECFFAISHAMTFDVGFGYHIDAVAVAELIPQTVVGIVACANGVDVVLLHYFNVLQHTFGRNDISAVGVEFVAVNTFEEHRQAVYQHLCIFNFHFSETGGYRNYFVAGLGRESVEIWCFGSPFICVFHFNTGVSAFGCRSAGHLIAIGIGECKSYRQRAIESEVNVEHAVGVIVFEVGGDTYIGNAFFVAGIEVAVACHAAKTEEILVFEI